MAHRRGRRIPGRGGRRSDDHRPALRWARDRSRRSGCGGGGGAAGGMVDRIDRGIGPGVDAVEEAGRAGRRRGGRRNVQRRPPGGSRRDDRCGYRRQAGPARARRPGAPSPPVLATNRGCIGGWAPLIHEGSDPLQETEVIRAERPRRHAVGATRLHLGWREPRQGQGDQRRHDEPGADRPIGHGYDHAQGWIIRKRASVLKRRSATRLQGGSRTGRLRPLHGEYAGPCPEIKDASGRGGRRRAVRGESEKHRGMCLVRRVAGAAESPSSRPTRGVDLRSGATSSPSLSARIAAPAGYGIVPIEPGVSYCCD